MMSRNIMEILISPDRAINGQTAAVFGAERIRAAIGERGCANVILATGASQFEMLEALLQEEVDWSKVTVFHLDEYVGIPVTHPASFRKYLWERFHSRLPVPLRGFHYVAGDGDADVECRRLGALISSDRIDVCFAGIGENAHLAFNDPPADFETEIPYIRVALDEDCRRQQFGEGWFETLEAVPLEAISMSIRQILKSRCLVITVPDERKAKAVRDSLQGEVSARVPASILRQHGDTHIFLDPASASLLDTDGQ